MDKNRLPQPGLFDDFEPDESMPSPVTMATSDHTDEIGAPAKRINERGNGAAPGQIDAGETTRDGQIYDINEGAWVMREISQIAYGFQSFHDAQVWLLDHDFELPEGWDVDSYKGAAEAWRREFINHIFGTMERRQHLITLLAQHNDRVESLLPKPAFDAKEFMEGLETERVRLFHEKVELAIKDVVTITGTRQFVNRSRLRKWFKEHDIQSPSWMDSDRSSTRNSLEGYLRSQLLDYGRLRIVDVAEGEDDPIKRTTLVKNPDKSKWEETIQQTIDVLGSKSVAEQWLTSKGLGFPEKWNSPRAHWDTQLRYYFNYLLQRGDLAIEKNGHGANVLIVTDIVL